MVRSTEVISRLLSDYEQLARTIDVLTARLMRDEGKAWLTRQAQLVAESARELAQAIERDIPE